MEWYQIRKCSDGVKQNDFTFGFIEHQNDDGWACLSLEPARHNGDGYWYVRNKDLIFIKTIESN